VVFSSSPREKLLRSWHLFHLTVVQCGRTGRDTVLGHWPYGAYGPVPNAEVCGGPNAYPHIDHKIQNTYILDYFIYQYCVVDCSRRVRTLYACEAENDSELSFEPNQIITNGELWSS